MSLRLALTATTLALHQHDQATAPTFRDGRTTIEWRKIGGKWTECNVWSWVSIQRNATTGQETIIDDRYPLRMVVGAVRKLVDKLHELFFVRWAVAEVEVGESRREKLDWGAERLVESEIEEGEDAPWATWLDRTNRSVFEDMEEVEGWWRD